MGDKAPSDDGVVVSGLLAADLLPDLHDNQAFCDGGGGGGPPTPSSVEAQADDDNELLDLDLDHELPEPSFPLNDSCLGGGGDTGGGNMGPDVGPSLGPIYGPANDPLAEATVANEAGASTADNNDLSGFFDFLNPGDAHTDEVDAKSETAQAGVVGLRNVGNTCYMNSGLQCLMATPSVVRFFLVDFKSKREPSSLLDIGDMMDPVASAKKQLSSHFGPLVEDMWRGGYKKMRPKSFKAALGERHLQFKGSMQHDCQEFLALLLDTLHDELMAARFACDMKCSASALLGQAPLLFKANSSMEMNAAESAQMDDEDAGGGGGECGMKAASATSAAAPGASVTSEDDRTSARESESASPKSFDSHSSIDDKATLSAIRNQPIPPEMKTFESSSNKLSAMQEEDGDDDNTLDSSGSSSKQQPTSNLVAPDSLKRRETASSQISKDGERQINNEREVTIDDYIKDSKTLNVNVLDEGSDQLRNNEINFDSEKFSRHHENARPQETIDNLNMSEAHSFDKKMNAKRFGAETADESFLCADDAAVDVDMVAVAGSSSVASTSAAAVIDGFGGIKRIRLDSSDKEKNVQLEMERRMTNRSELEEESSEDVSKNEDITDGAASAVINGACGGEPAAASCASANPQRLKEIVEADRHWEKYLSMNNSVITRTFQGQFKNTVVCQVCQFVSVSFEPFMYLPVPLPNGLVRQTEVTVVSPRRYPSAKKFLLEMTQADNVGALKRRVSEKVAGAVDDDLVSRLQVSEVINHHISRTVDDWCMLKHLRDDRAIFVIEVLSVDLKEGGQDAPSSVNDGDTQECEISSSTVNEVNMASSTGGAGDCEVQGGGDVVVSSSTDAASAAAAAAAAFEYQSCVICMEELPPDQVRQHNACKCVMCNPCIDRSIEHHENADRDMPKGQIRCPGCRENADPAVEFVRPDQIGKSRPKLKALCLPVVMRIEDIDGNTVVFGSPSQISVPNQISGGDLFDLLMPPERKRLVPHSVHFEVVLTDSQGKGCARCLFHADPCRGCVRIGLGDEDVLLQSNDTVALTFLCETSCREASALLSSFRPERDSSLDGCRLAEVLSLEDCIGAFSESETLDQSNPWFCPDCQKNQCAMKTLTIWRLPDFLIVYLKRFIYIDSNALKLEKPVEFPLSGLDMSPFLSGPYLPPPSTTADSDRPLFDLYATVNHYGSVGGGHYTAFCRHMPSSQWNYFDDCCVSENKVPGDQVGDQSAAYVLFFQRRGTEDPDLPLGSFDSDSPPPSVCQNLEKFNHDDHNAVNAMNEEKATPAIDAGSEAVATVAAESRVIPSLPTPAPAL